MIAVLAMGGTLYAVGTLTIGQRFLQRLGVMAERAQGLYVTPLPQPMAHQLSAIEEAQPY